MFQKVCHDTGERRRRGTPRTFGRTIDHLTLEIAIKQSIGKLGLKNTVNEIGQACYSQDMRLLDARLNHYEAIKSLPDIYKDPLGRLIVAQAQCEVMTIAAMNANMAKYDAQTVWG